MTAFRINGASQNASTYSCMVTTVGGRFGGVMVGRDNLIHVADATSEKFVHFADVCLALNRRPLRND